MLCKLDYKNVTTRKITNLPNVPQNLHGLWRRTFFQWEDGDIDRSTEVFYLQTPRLFADIRIPASRPDLGRANSLQNLTRDELLALTEQMAFAGYTKIEGDHIYWNHAIDNLPDSSFEGAVDVGRFRIRKNVMQEFGVHFNYTEYWRRIDTGGGKFLSLWTPPQDARPEAILVIGGDHFIYACDHGIRESFSNGLADFLKTAPRSGQVPLSRVLSWTPQRRHKALGDLPFYHSNA